jgi:hypothetical protein
MQKNSDKSIIMKTRKFTRRQVERFYLKSALTSSEYDPVFYYDYI